MIKTINILLITLTILLFMGCNKSPHEVTQQRPIPNFGIIPFLKDISVLVINNGDRIQNARCEGRLIIKESPILLFHGHSNKEGRFNFGWSSQKLQEIIHHKDKVTVKARCYCGANYSFFERQNVENLPEDCINLETGENVYNIIIPNIFNTSKFVKIKTNIFCENITNNITICYNASSRLQIDYQFREY